MRKIALLSVVAFTFAAYACSSAPEPQPPPAPSIVAPPPTVAETAAPAPSVTATATAVASAPPPPPPPCPSTMALIPGGSYPHGLKKETVKVEPFCLDLTETTADQYATCVGDKKCSEDFLSCAPQHTWKVAGQGNRPIVCVDFKQANDYCSAQGKRLATEEEWEWAARGEDKGSAYPWGDDPPKDQLCWAGGAGKKPEGPCDVGSFTKGDNPQGVHDLAGNVFEWTVSKNDATSPNRDGRGGSWKDGTAPAFKVNRPGAFAPGYRCGFLGIRCVQPPAK